MTILFEKAIKEKCIMKKKNRIPTGLLTRNNSIDCHEYKSSSNLHKKQIFDAIAAASIVNNCSGVDTSKSQVITLATFTKFLESRQQERLTDDEIKALIKVHTCTYVYTSIFFFAALIELPSIIFNFKIHCLYLLSISPIRNMLYKTVLIASACTIDEKKKDPLYFFFLFASDKVLPPSLSCIFAFLSIISYN